ncbi:MAG: hypothetical protein HW421_3235 [Ignavibacteria bacterium]|nr:hypothetical protein [Ignavibacteria bacterium]
MKQIRIIILFIILPIISFAFSGKGSGTKEDPYQITNIIQLQEINNDYFAYYILMNDIDASDTKNWNVGDHDGNPATPNEARGFNPIMEFFGSLDGKGYIISNLYINRPREMNVGLIGYLGPTTDLHPSKINKLGIENCDITGSFYVGSICGMSDAGSILQCFSTGKVQTTVKGNDNCIAAGFCGRNNSVRIENCFSMCSVSSKYDLFDYAISSFCTYSGVSLCYTTGKVNSSKKVSAFGIFSSSSGCYFDIETTGINDSNGINQIGMYGRSTNDMKIQSTYHGWDFKNVWYMKEEADYPKLRAFMKPAQAEEAGLVAAILTIDITPNPATATAQIRYSAPYANIIKITITNIYGEEVAVPVSSQSHAAGQFTAELDVSKFPSGVYFCVLQTPAVAVTRQFVVVH